MSNARAIAAVTATLQSICQEIANDVVPGARITTQRPDARDEAKDIAGLNVFLYRASVNSTFRNHDTPTRDSRGRVTKRPATGFDLDYLFTFYGPSAQSQLLMGQTVAALHTEPYLTPRRISETIEAEIKANAKSPIAQADLAEQQERLRLTPIPLDLEELSKLWSVFLQVPYDLSIAYRVSVVLISGDVSPRSALPVRRSGASATGMPPRIEQIAIQIDDKQQPTHVSLRGKHLIGDLEIQFGDLPPLPPLPAEKDTATDEVQAKLSDDLIAGVTPVRVIRKIVMPPEETNGKKDDTSNGSSAGATSGTASGTTIGTTTGISTAKPPEIRRLASNDVFIIVRPEIQSVTYDKGTDTLTLEVTRVKPGQRGTLLLNQFFPDKVAPTPPAGGAPIPPATGAPTPPDVHEVALDFRVTEPAAGDGGRIELTPLIGARDKVPTGSYLVRIRIDGGESALVVETKSGRYVDPQVAIE